MKATEKHLIVNNLDPVAFDRTVEEVKHRYYEVARALLLHRKESGHLYLKYDQFDIEQEVYRKNNWERVFSRGKEQLDAEKDILREHLRVESQIRKVEQEDAKKLRLIAKQAGVKVPIVIPCQLIDPKQEVDPERREDQKEEDDNGQQSESIYDKVGIPISRMD